jgi:hypothetical protein
MLGLAAAAPAAVPGWSLRELAPTGPAGPPFGGLGPSPPVLLQLDDGTAESAFGVSGATSRPFLWFQVFDAPVPRFDLEQIWVLFPNAPEVVPGAPIQLVVYRDDDLDPSTLTHLLLARDEVVQVADGNTFSVYVLPDPVEFSGGGRILIGVVSRFAISGVTPPTQPAALDTSSSAGRSWIATWTGDPPDPPLLPPDQSLFRIDDLVPGNWMIRGLGTAVESPLEIPTLGGTGIALLAALLALAAYTRLRRDRRRLPAHDRLLRRS